MHLQLTIAGLRQVRLIGRLLPLQPLTELVTAETLEGLSDGDLTLGLGPQVDSLVGW